ncbi:hypothetical protein GBA63_09110 [Rubrobacter tropicus]|uniref:Uncharacterized protein n=1 Tax=Rubrobacter tropicus TaxID=2653851 RepID=A0A6G8Q8J3_9ACTN|nr:hypothetical protein [Rubrobacter tropicus]QIN82791.1 hypothetical protein GBA63_09110 [Rubrobacter tropicus]
MRSGTVRLHFLIRDMSRPLHFTIGTGLGLHPTVGQLSLENDLLLVKAGLLYADRVRLCSIGSSLALEFAKLKDASNRQRMEFLRQYFEDLASTNPEAAVNMREFVTTYRDLQRRRGGTRSKAQIQTMFEVQAGMRRIWAKFEEGIGEFLRVAGADGIMEAVDTGLLDLHRFEAGGVERMGGLGPEDQDRRQEEFVEDLFWEFLNLIGDAVADGDTNPLFDQMSGNLVRTGMEAGVVSPTESGEARGRHSGLASDLLRQLPLFEKATVKEILDIRRELESPLIRFRGAVIGMSEDIRSAAWDEDFPSDADKEFRKVVKPAVLEIEEAVQDNGSLRSLLFKGIRPGDWATGLGVMISTLAGLPDAASVLLGSGTTTGMTARGAYKEWLEDRKRIESNHMFFYYETRERLAALDSAAAATTVRSWRAKPEALEAEVEAEGAALVDQTPSEAEREAQKFMNENEDLLDEGGYATLQRLLTQGFHASKDLTVELTETAKQYAPARRALNEAMRNPNTRPRRMYELEREVEQLRPIYERKKRLNEKFSEFLDRAASAYEREGGEL